MKPWISPSPGWRSPASSRSRPCRSPPSRPPPRRRRPASSCSWPSTRCATTTSRASPPAFTGGFRRLMRDGAVFTNAHLDHYPSVTAVGHSAMLTGAPPSISGIVGNDWYDRALKKNVTSVEDPGTKLLGAGDGDRLLAAPPAGQHGRRRAEDGAPRLARDRDLAQGPQRDPDGGPDGRPRPVVGHADGRLRLEHLVRPGAAEVGRGLQRGPARGRVAGPRVARAGRGRRAVLGKHARDTGAGLLRQPLQQRVRQRAPRVAGGGRARGGAAGQPRRRPTSWP